METWLVMLLLLQAGREDYIFKNAYLELQESPKNSAWNGVLGKNHSLHKRGLLELSGVIKCSTSRFPLVYLGYGCYCGPGGNGWPKDETDWCCREHDCCYGFAEKEGCCIPILREYNWDCKDNTVICDTVLDRCQKIICQCDSEAAKCWRSASFSEKYVFWPNFLCGNVYPVCEPKSQIE